MALVLMGWGGHRFSVPGINYNQLSRRFHYRWVPQMRVGRRPAQQWLGPGEEELRIHGILFPFAYGGYSQLNAIRADAEAGIPHGLADAKGIYYGPWCCRMVTDDQEFFHPDGNPRRVEFDMELCAYGI